MMRFIGEVVDKLTPEHFTPSNAHSLLLVEDDPLTLKALVTILENQGYLVQAARNGIEALQILNQNPIALIICDQQMPGMSGLEVLKKAIEIQPDAVRIALTGVSDVRVVEQLVNIGKISQFIVKPWENTSLIQTVHSSLEKYHLLKENRRLQLLTQKQHEELEENHENLQREIQLSARIHEVMLLGKIPESIPGIVIDAATFPSKEIDGDFFGFYRPVNEIFDLAIGDVMGKGLPAALVGTAVKSQLTRFAEPLNASTLTFSKLTGWHQNILSPSEIINHVHNELSTALLEIEYFVTLIYGRFDLRKHTFTFVDCGAPKTLHYKKSYDKFVELSGKNIPLGVIKDELYQSHEVLFQEQDIFLFYSDGVTEAQSNTGTQFGLQRLIDVIKNHINKTPQEIIEAISEALKKHTNKTTWDDDVTLCVIKIVALPNFPPSQHSISSKFVSDLSQLKAVRDFVKQVCQKAPEDAKQLIPTLQLAINEIFCNIVKHGYKGNPRGEIIIKGEFTKDGILFDIADQGLSFNPSLIANPSLGGFQESGFGLYMIKEISDSLSYKMKESEEDMNHLCLLKKYHTHEGTMDISHHFENAILTISPLGENLDAKVAPHFKQKISELIEKYHTHNIILNLEHLHFIDSSGLGSLLSLLRSVNTQGGDLKLAAATKQVRTVLELVCMHKIFEIYNSTQEAMKSFKTHTSKLDT